MDFKKLAAFIIILGVLIFGYGSTKFLTNLPKRFNPAESKPGIFGGRNDLANMLNVQETNAYRAIKRKNAVMFIVVGGAISFIGIGISVAAKKKENP